ncbi:hypothetical protein GGR56DRAFT_695344 [Xylariaceae sp. FL0804]|nr:hypothetical protein GGR56DRAFT_695344 [Xylariaceae sp. FL0804]
MKLIAESQSYSLGHCLILTIPTTAMATPTPPLNVLIVGCGIAGPALAYWLSRIDNARVTIIERSPHLRTTGQQVDLRAQGVPMMRKMGIEAAVRQVMVKEPGSRIVDRHGRVQASFRALGKGTGSQGPTSDFEIMRGDLVRILAGLTQEKENVRYLFNTTVDSFTQDDESDPNGKVHVTFHNGQREAFDMVVAADGSNSRTRALMLGPDAPDPRRRNASYIGFFSVPGRGAESDDSDSSWATFCVLPGHASMGRMVLTRRDVPDLLRVNVILRGRDAALTEALKARAERMRRVADGGGFEEMAAADADTAAPLKKAVADLLRGGGWQCERFVDALEHAPEADDFYFTPEQEVVLPPGSWSRGRVVLLGDAAWGQGANGLGVQWGLLGAYTLAGEVAGRLVSSSPNSKTSSKSNSSLNSSPSLPLSPSAAVVQGAAAYEAAFRPTASSGQSSGGRHHDNHNNNKNNKDGGGGGHDAEEEEEEKPWSFEDLFFPRTRFGVAVFHWLAWALSVVRFDVLVGWFVRGSEEVPDYPVLDGFGEGEGERERAKGAARPSG